MSRCDLHCPQPSGFPWLAILIAAAAALALWGVGHLLQTVGKPILVLVAAGALAGITGLIVLFATDARTSTPRRVHRPRLSETVTQQAIAPPTQPAAELEPAAYPSLRAVPDLEERAA